MKISCTNKTCLQSLCPEDSLIDMKAAQNFIFIFIIKLHHKIIICNDERAASQNRKILTNRNEKKHIDYMTAESVGLHKSLGNYLYDN